MVNEIYLPFQRDSDPEHFSPFEKCRRLLATNLAPSVRQIDDVKVGNLFEKLDKTRVNIAKNTSFAILKMLNRKKTTYLN